MIIFHFSRVRKFTLSWLLLLLVFTMAFSQDRLEPRRYYLKNGLEVILVEMHKAPIIISRLYYKVGSRNEEVGKTGISHVVEHMMFKGTEKFPTGKISKLIKRNSGVFNAFTSTDLTCYFEQMPKNKIDIALEIEADRMHNCVFDPEEFKKEIEVIKEERRLRIENSPEAILMEELRATFYMSHPYHWPIIGWMNDLNNITRDDAYRYYRTYYTPNNAVLVLVGDFDSREMLKKVEKYFGKIPKGPEVPQRHIVEPAIRTKKLLQKESVLVANRKYIAYFQGVDFTSRDYPVLYLATQILASGRSSRLYKKLVRTRLCSSVRLSVQHNQDLSPISFFAELYPETSLDTVKAIFRQEVERMKNEPVTSKELRKIKNRFKTNSVYMSMAVADVASRLGNYEVKAGNFAYYDSLLQQIDRVTKDDIQRVMKQYFNFTYYVEGILSPGDSTTAPEKATLTAARKSSAPANPLPEHEIKSEPEEKVPFNPDDFIRPNPIAPKLKEFKLSNGIQVIFYEDHTFPIIELNGIIKIGNATMNDELPGVGDLTADMIKQGSQRFPYQVLIDTLSMMAAGVNFHRGDENIYFSWGTIKENFPTLTDIGSDLLQHPAFPENELERLKKRRIAVLKDAEKRTGWKTSRYIVNRIFEGHPYRRIATIDGLKRITVDDLKRFHRIYYRPELTTLVVIGDISQPRLKELLEKYLGVWKNPTPFKPVPYPEQKKLTSLEIKVYTNYEDKQVTVKIAHGMPNNQSPDVDKLEMANYILGGSSLTSRLGVNIRDKQGLTYGITSQLKLRNHGGWILIASQTAPQNTGQLLISALYEIERFRKEGATEAELNDAKRYFLGTLPMVVETPLDIQAVITGLVEDNKPLNDFDTYPDRIIRITLDDVQEAARTYFHPEKAIIAIGGPITPEEVHNQIQTALQKMNISLPFSIETVKITPLK